MRNILDNLLKGILGESHFEVTPQNVTQVQTRPNIINQARALPELISQYFSSRDESVPPPVTTPAPSPTSVPSPTPTQYPLRPEILSAYGTENYPYKEEIQQTWPGVDPNQVANVFFGESGLQPNRYHINAPLWQSGYAPPTREAWENLRSLYPSIDVGLPQLNTAEAMNNYLASKGLTYYDLFSNPKAALEIAYDLYSGQIPYTAPGWDNWVAVQKLREMGYDY